MLQCGQVSTWPHFVQSGDEEYPRRLMKRIVCSLRSCALLHRVDEPAGEGGEAAAGA